MVKVNVKKLHKDAVLPVKGSEDSACFDVFAVEDKTVFRHQTEIISIGLAFEMEYESSDLSKFAELRPYSDTENVEDIKAYLDYREITDFKYEILVRSRSGLASKYGVHAIGGEVDEDYRGEVKVILANTSKKDYIIKKGDRIAQIKVVRLPRCNYEFVDELNATERGSNGFGSTGV